jgi:HK97 family phage major capsid protein/HK97 family phage prohead protease
MTPEQILRDTRSRDLRREFSVRADAIDDDKLTVELSFVSEEPVERWYGREVLECTGEACDFSRLNDGAPLLIGHNPECHQGVVEKAWMGNDKVGRARVRFADDDEAKKYFRRVKTGILRKVSVGYRIHELVLQEQSDGELDTYRAKHWEPFEISLVSIPADNSVGVGRSHPSAVEERPQPTTRTMNPETTPAAPVAAPTSAPPAAPITTREVPFDSNRVAEIRAIGAKYKVNPDEIIEYIATNRSLDDFRAHVLEKYFNAKPVATPPEIGMSRAEKRRYSFQRAIARLASRQPLDGLEKEASDAAEKQYRRPAEGNGFIVPHDVSAAGDRELVMAMFRVNPSLENTRYGAALRRDLYAGVFAGAGALVPEEFLGGSFIDILRNRMLLTQLGVGTLSGLVGNVAIPRQSGAATAYWLAEGDSVTESDQSFAQVAATPRRLAAQTAFSKQLLAQAGLDAEALIRDDLQRVVAIAKDLAGIAGSGGAEPLGILNGPTTDGSGASTSNAIRTVTFGAAPNWGNVLKFEKEIQTQNADIGTMQWLTNPTVRTKWKETVKVANYPVFLCSDDNKANGYPINITNQVGTSGTYANRTIFGAWGQAMFCDWAGMDVVVDPYTQAASNKIVVTLNMFADFIVRHWPSFCISTDSGAQ